MNKYNGQGFKHGPWEVYHGNGQLLYKGNYVDGKRHGLFEQYHPNGQLWYKVNYVNGKMHGLNLWYNYYTNGNLRNLEFFL